MCFYGFRAKGVKIFIGNVNEFTTESELQKLFEQHGEVAECDIIKNFAFVVSFFDVYGLLYF